MNSFSTTIKGVVSIVMDGDTVLVETLEGGYQVRLLGVDAPELFQPYGEEAKKFLKDITYNKPVTLELRERKGTSLYTGEVFVEKKNLGSLLLEKGYAWYNGGDSKYGFEKMEAKARRRRIGLWRDASPVPPWIYRKLRVLHNYMSRSEEFRPNEIVYVAMRGNDYHKISCSHVTGPVTSYTVLEAEKMGYTPCPICGY